MVVRPGVDAGRVAFALEGATAARVNGQGDLEVELPTGQVLVHRKPHAYQVVDGEERPVAARFALEEHSGVFVYRFALAKHDRTKALVIDPVVLSYSTFLGGAGEERATDVAVDAAGHVYVVGYPYSADFPTKNSAQPFRGGSEVFVSKLSSKGDELVWSTLLGGSDRDDGYDLAVDAAGNVYVAGITGSQDFPTKNAFQGDQGDEDAFVAKLDPAQKGAASLVYATFLGGDGPDAGFDIAVDGSGSAYVTGYARSGTFPVTQGAFDSVFQGMEDAFVAKLDPTGGHLQSSTFLGGKEEDEAWGIAVDSGGGAVVAGYTRSRGFPATPNAYQSKARGQWDAFVTKLGHAEPARKK